jgi:tetratricopeptide (TPR) repeat protein
MSETGRRDAILRVAVGCTLILIATFVAYGPALQGGFVWDDDAYVTANPLLTQPDGLWRIWFSRHTQSQYFPLVYTTLRFEYALFGQDPLGYHVVNVLLHGLNALLAWAVLARLAVPGAWLAAAVFALHPVQVETAAWITELKNTQSTFFSLLALLAWLRFSDDARERPRRYYALSLGLYALALLSKTTACTLPAALVLVLWLRGRALGPRRWLEIAPFVALGLVMGLVSIWWERHLGNYEEIFGLSLPWPERVLVATRALWFYLGKLVWPAALSFSYPRWELDPAEPAQWLWAVACVALAATLWFGRRRLGRGPLAAAAFFVATLSPMLGFVPLFTFYYAFVADHYQYAACLGPIALFAAATSRLAPGRPALRAGAAGVLLVVLAALTWRQAGAYRSHETLWQDALAKNPGSWLAHNNLGVLLAARGEREEAEAHYRDSVTLQPDNAEARFNLANLLAATGRAEEALAHYEAALRVRPGRAHYHQHYGRALLSLGRIDAAVAAYREAVRRDPGSIPARMALALALERQGVHAEAALEYREVLRRDPTAAQAAARLRPLAPGADGPP